MKRKNLLILLKLLDMVGPDDVRRGTGTDWVKCVCVVGGSMKSSLTLLIITVVDWKYFARIV